MAGRIRFSFRLRILFILLGSCWILAGAFMIFQYHREREFKTGIMDARLQMHNARIIDDLRRGEAPAEIVARINAPAENLRVTIIDREGNAVYDNRRRHIFGNHNSRPEIIEARASGEGYTIERLSESDDRNYFYSARLADDGMVVRSAAPYNHNLTEFLRADITIIWIMAAMTLLISLIGLYATRKISVSIGRLNRFAEKAEKGENIYEGYSFPRDELGSIAGHIVRLYVQRDRQHAESLRLEQDRIRLKKQLTNNINHELKTPVASILVSLDLLDDHPQMSDERKKEILQRVRANAGRLSALLKDVATITRMDDAPEMIVKERIDLTSLIEDVVEEARLRTDMTITADLPQLFINGNRSLLESVFRNLIDNAVAYSGGTEIHITGDSEGNFRFGDNGDGIAAEHLPHIFERFYRVDNGRTRFSGGTGLGLSIVRNAVAVHGGNIRAFNNGGLMFEFNLVLEKS